MMQDSSNFLCGVELVTTRGPLSDKRAIKISNFAKALTYYDRVDWVSITDNAGGNPMIGPTALGKPILYAGKEVIVHLSCKDLNRNGLEREAWLLASEGFDNILCLSGDYPISGYEGIGKPVFDIDSVGLLSMLVQMNQGLDVSRPGQKKKPPKLAHTNFFLGAVVSNIKLYENEMMPQLLKLEKKLQLGAEYIINQISYDSRKIHELKVYLGQKGYSDLPLFGNVYVLSAGIAKVFNAQRIPGVVVSDALLAECQKQGQSEDKGKAFFLELAAKQVAIYRALGYRGAYLGGVHSIEDIEKILDMEKSFSSDDWKTFAHEISYSRPGEFFLYEADGDTGLADAQQMNRSYLASLEKRKATGNVTFSYRLSKKFHDWFFTPGKGLYDKIRRIYSKAKDSEQGPKLLRKMEHSGKAMMFGCKDCGDCSLQDIAFLCPESSCAKNQRNGPCGGTRSGKCEVEEFDCIWAKAYDRLKYEGRENELLDHAPVLQNQALRGTSSWANTYLQRDHHGKEQNS